MEPTNNNRYTTTNEQNQAAQVATTIRPKTIPKPEYRMANFIPKSLEQFGNKVWPKIKNGFLNIKTSALCSHISEAAGKLTSLLSNMIHLRKQPSILDITYRQAIDRLAARNQPNRPALAPAPIPAKFPQHVETQEVKTNINKELVGNSEEIFLASKFYDHFQTSKWRTIQQSEVNLGSDVVYNGGSWDNNPSRDYVVKYFDTPVKTIFGNGTDRQTVFSFIFSGYSGSTKSRYSYLEKGMRILLIKILTKTAELTKEANKLNNNTNKTSEELKKLDTINNTISLIKGTLTDTSDNGVQQCSNRLKSIIENCASYLDQAESPSGTTEDMIKKMLGDIKNVALNSVEAADVTDSAGHIVGTAIKPEKMINTRHKFSAALGLPTPQESYNNYYQPIPDNIVYKTIAKNLSTKKITESIEAQLDTVADEIKEKMSDDIQNEPISLEVYAAIVKTQNKQLNTKELTEQSITELRHRIHELIEQSKNWPEEEINDKRKELQEVVFLLKWLEGEQNRKLPLSEIRKFFVNDILMESNFEKTKQLFSLFADTDAKLLTRLYIPTFLVNKHFLIIPTSEGNTVDSHEKVVQIKPFNLAKHRIK